MLNGILEKYQNQDGDEVVLFNMHWGNVVSFDIKSQEYLLKMYLWIYVNSTTELYHKSHTF